MSRPCWETREARDHGDFFRITHRPPTVEDFQSNREKGRDPMPTEIADPWEYAGISTFDSFDGAARKAREVGGRFGWYVTRIGVPEGAGATGRCSPRTGHCTLGAPPGRSAAAFFWPLRMDTRPVPR
ncbi:MAG TPA: hypothetical protein VG370_20110 [Chloroflexota bacterium]|jgi:hypothetical protein|nr:hypothetical protein [Chloroflexota bacterium]